MLRETRGAKMKYDFGQLATQGWLSFSNTTTGTILNCAKRYAAVRGFDWKFRCYSHEGKIFIVKINSDGK